MWALNRASGISTILVQLANLSDDGALVFVLGDEFL
jgi:hypothetical protein